MIKQVYIRKINEKLVKKIKNFADFVNWCLKEKLPEYLKRKKGGK